MGQSFHLCQKVKFSNFALHNGLNYPLQRGTVVQDHAGKIHVRWNNGEYGKYKAVYLEQIGKEKSDAAEGCE